MHNEIYTINVITNIQKLVVRCIQLSILTPCSKHVGVCVRGGCLQSLILKNSYRHYKLTLLFELITVFFYYKIFNIYIFT